MKEIIYYTIYKITNLINNKIYIGKHQTKKLNDRYMGGGICINEAYKKYGKENFKKEILFVFDTYEEMNNKEIEIVNDGFIKRKDVYNISIGGDGGAKFKEENGVLVGYNKGKITVKDEYDNTFQVDKNDKRYLSGELKFIQKDMVVVKDENCEIFSVSVNDERYLRGELKSINCDCAVMKDKDGNIKRVNVKNTSFNRENYTSINKDKIIVIDNNGNRIKVDRTDQRWVSGEFVAWNKNTVMVKDKNGKYSRVEKNDERYLCGELTPITKGNKLSEEHKKKISDYWAKRRKPKKVRNWICDKNNNYKLVLESDLDGFLNDGWILSEKP